MNSDIEIIKNKFPQVLPALRRAGIRTLKDGGDRILREAKRQIVRYDAIDTGNMLNSGYIRTAQTDGLPVGIMFPGQRLPAPTTDFELQVNFAASYSYYVHEGTAFVTSRPFLRNAVELTIPYIRRRFQQVVGEELK